MRTGGKSNGSRDGFDPPELRADIVLCVLGKKRGKVMGYQFLAALALLLLMGYDFCQLDTQITKLDGFPERVH